jgi:methylphosphotriester-DNA--protein-cysteine methyltransferase
LFFQIARDPPIQRRIERATKRAVSQDSGMTNAAYLMGFNSQISLWSHSSEKRSEKSGLIQEAS